MTRFSDSGGEASSGGCFTPSNGFDSNINEEGSATRFLCHSSHSGFKRVIKDDRDGENGSEKDGKTVDASRKVVNTETVGPSPIKPHRLVPVQVISPPQPSPVVLPDKSSEKGTKGIAHLARFSLPRFSAFNPKVNRLHRAAVSDRCASTPENLECKSMSDIPSIPLHGESGAGRPRSCSLELQRGRVRYEEARTAATFSQVFATARPAPQHRKLGKKAIKKKSVKEAMSEHVATFLPTTLSMLAPTDNFSFGIFHEQFPSEQVVVAPSFDEAGSLTIPCVLNRLPTASSGEFVSGSSSNKQFVTSPKHGRGDDEEGNGEYSETSGTKRKSPRLLEPAEHEVNSAALASSHFTSRKLDQEQDESDEAGEVSNLTPMAGFSTPTEQMWQNLSTPPFLQPVLS